jgi:hypothetical protein
MAGKQRQLCIFISGIVNNPIVSPKGFRDDMDPSLSLGISVKDHSITRSRAITRSLSALNLEGPSGI